MKNQKYKKVEIEWIDSYASLEDSKIEPYLRTSVGYITGETKDYIRLSQNIIKGEEIDSPHMYITKKSITKKWII